MTRAVGSSSARASSNSGGGCTSRRRPFPRPRSADEKACDRLRVPPTGHGVPGGAMETWSVNGIELAVLVEGSGPLVVLAHGFPDIALTWRLQVPALVAAGYRVVAPGHARVRRQLASSLGRGLPQRRGRRGPGGTARPRGRGARALRRARLGCLERVAAGPDPSRPGAVADRPERPVRAAVARAADRDLPEAAGRGLLHAPLPQRRRDPGARARSRPHARPHPERPDRRPGTRRRGGASDVAARGRLRGVRRRLHAQRFRRSAQLLPEPRPQLAASRRSAKPPRSRCRRCS